MAKRTYTVPDQTVDHFEIAVASGDRSRVVTELIQNWLSEKKREETRKQVIEGCREMSDIYREVAAEWSATDEETWRAL